MTYTTAEKVARVLTYAFGEPDGDYETVTGVAYGYAEPGYGSLAGDDVVVFGNWNPKRFPRDGEPPLTAAESFPDRLARTLEHMGAEIEWLDEWTSCVDCQRAVRTQPDSYSWKPSYSDTDDGPVCHECVRKDGEDALEDYVNNADKAVTWADAAFLESFGYERLNSDSYESGWHPGQTDDPHAILAGILQDRLDAKVVFLLDENSQFYLRFSAYVKEEEAETDE